VTVDTGVKANGFRALLPAGHVAIATRERLRDPPGRSACGMHGKNLLRVIVNSEVMWNLTVYVTHNIAYVIHTFNGVNRNRSGMSGKSGRKQPRPTGADPGLAGVRDVHPASRAGSVGEALRKRSGLLWDDQQRPSRGPRPALSRSEVVQAAIRVADEGDLAALTMQAVAQRLGFTTMALYRYFPNKEALIDACVDAAMGAPPETGRTGQGWRADVKRWAYAKRAMLCARPWLAELPFVAAPHGPNWLGWHEAFLSTISDTGLSPEDMMDMLSVVHGYVSGSSDTAISLSRARSRGISFEEWAQAVGEDLCRAIDDPRYPTLSAILSSKSGGISKESPLPARNSRPRTLDESFDFGLERVLDGIGLYIDALKRP
jgi:AcrR family transcriptional regulator